jgi:predicted nucleotidyltransferase
MDDKLMAKSSGDMTTPYLRLDMPIPSWLDDQTATLVRAITLQLVERHADVLAVILFGSVARHDERPLDAPAPSDVDLLLLVPECLPEERALAIHHTIGEAGNPYGYTPREVQVLLMERDQANWDSTFVANVAREGWLLWAREPLPRSFAPIAARAPSRTALA